MGVVVLDLKRPLTGNAVLDACTTTSPISHPSGPDELRVVLSRCALIGACPGMSPVTLA